MMTSDPDGTHGQIITFYSYKGGTGRTMALANVACLLAERQQSLTGKDVLVVDWDLEAPGLHRFFRSGQERRNGWEDGRDPLPGLIDLFYELDKIVDAHLENQRTLQRVNPEHRPPGSEEAAWTAIKKIDIKKYISPTAVKGISLLKAGRFNPKNPNEYSERVNKFNWEALYTKSPQLIRIFGEALAKEYTYVLIDSRTGVTDISGICTMLLPEKLVVVFTPNIQSVKGGLDLIRRATDYRKESSDLRRLLVFPLVSRIEANEPDLRHDWRFGSKELDFIGYQLEFEKLLAQAYDTEWVNLDEYFEEIQIQQIPRYAYGEQIAVLVEKTGDRFSLRRSYQAFVERLISSKVPWDHDDQRLDNRAVGPPPERVGRQKLLQHAAVGLAALIIAVILLFTILNRPPGAICSNVASSDECHGQYPTGCSITGKYDAYLNKLKNLVLSPGIPPVRWLLALKDFTDLDQKVPPELSNVNHREVATDLKTLGEGTVVGTIGYLYYAQKGGTSESSNCQLGGPNDIDFHIGIGFDAGLAGKLARKETLTTAEKGALRMESIIVEITPHWRARYEPGWSLDGVKAAVGHQVRVVGQLLVDNEHFNPKDDCAVKGASLDTCWRASAWELHPVTQLQVCPDYNCINTNANWVDLDFIGIVSPWR